MSEITANYLVTIQVFVGIAADSESVLGKHILQNHTESPDLLYALYPLVQDRIALGNELDIQEIKQVLTGKDF